jgi:hypothetical protein
MTTLTRHSDALDDYVDELSDVDIDEEFRGRQRSTPRHSLETNKWHSVDVFVSRLKLSLLSRVLIARDGQRVTFNKHSTNKTLKFKNVGKISVIFYVAFFVLNLFKYNRRNL